MSDYPIPDPDAIASLYDRWSHTYDSDANPTRDLASEVLRTAIGAVVGGDVVELGCGTGRNTGWLAAQARSLVGVDFSPGMLEKARARAVGERVRFIEQDLRDGLPLGDESADLVVIMLVLEHVEDVDPVFSECARVLRPGGHLFTCELHPYRQWAGAQAQFTDGATGERTRVPAHVHEVSEFVNGAIAAGMRLVRLDEWRAEVDGAEDTSPRLLSALHQREG